VRFQVRFQGLLLQTILSPMLKPHIRQSAHVVALALVMAGCSADSGTAPLPAASEPVASVDVAPTSHALYAGRTFQLAATVKDRAARTLTDRSVSWSSSNANAVSVTAAGLVTALGFGSATITAAAEGVSGSATVSVLHDPVVFMHGFQASASIWTTMTDRFKADGWTDAPLVAWTYDSNQSNTAIARILQTKVDSLLTATGAAKVDVIAHSMGGLSSRYYAKNLGGSEKIDAFVALATPNHGTTVANLCSLQSCLEMRPGSDFLAALNTGDETPGSPRYATWWSPCDDVPTPPESATLDGAANTQTSCLHHSDLYIDVTVYQQVRDWIR
jgi:triacylglycerol lipase